MKRSFFAIFFIAIALFMTSCKPADKKIDEKADTIAADYCDCLKNMEAKLSEDTKRIINNAAKSDDPSKSIENDVMKMGVEKGAAIGEEMEAVGDMEDPNSETGRCINKLDEKYKDMYTMNEDKTIKKIIVELDGKQGCDFTASLLKLGLKMKDTPALKD